MKTTIIDIVTQALCGKWVRLTGKYGESVTIKAAQAKKEAYGFGDVGVFLYADNGSKSRIDLTDEIEIFPDEKQEEKEG